LATVGLSTLVIELTLLIPQALHPAYTPPSRFSISSELLDNAHEDMKKIVDARVDRALASGDAIVGGDLWTDRSMTSI